MVAPTSGSNNGTKSYSNYSKNIARVYNNKYSNVVSGGPGDENNNSLEVPFINPFHQHSSSTNPYASQVYTNASVSPYNTYQQQTLSTTSSSLNNKLILFNSNHNSCSNNSNMVNILNILPYHHKSLQPH